MRIVPAIRFATNREESLSPQRPYKQVTGAAQSDVPSAVVTCRDVNWARALTTIVERGSDPRIGDVYRSTTGVRKVLKYAYGHP